MPRWSEVSVNLAEVKKDAQVVGGGARCRPRWLKVEVEPPTISTYGCRNIRHRPVDNWVFGPSLGH